MHSALTPSEALVLQSFSKLCLQGVVTGDTPCAGGKALDPDLAASVLMLATASGEEAPFKLAYNNYLEVPSTCWNCFRVTVSHATQEPRHMVVG